MEWMVDCFWGFVVVICCIILWLRDLLKALQGKRPARCSKEQCVRVLTRSEPCADDAAAALPELPAFDAATQYFKHMPPYASSSAYYRHRHCYKELEPAVLWQPGVEPCPTEASALLKENVVGAESWRTSFCTDGADEHAATPSPLSNVAISWLC